MFWRLILGVNIGGTNKMSNNKMTLYISDLDGTLLNANKEISDYTKEIINAHISKGGYFSVATARTVASAIKLLSDININMPVVLMNGVVIYDIKRSKYLKTEPIPMDSSKIIIEKLKRCKITGFMYAIADNELNTFYENLDTEALRDFHDERVKRYYKSFERVDGFIEKVSDYDVVYFTLIDEYRVLKKVFSQLKDVSGIDMALYRDVYSKSLWYLEIYSVKASKSSAVDYLRENYGFDRIIGFGDNYNDISLVNTCDEFYAVSNGVEELKKRATGVIDDNNSNGVAKFIANTIDYE